QRHSLAEFIVVRPGDLCPRHWQARKSLQDDGDEAGRQEDTDRDPHPEQTPLKHVVLPAVARCSVYPSAKFSGRQADFEPTTFKNDLPTAHHARLRAWVASAASAATWPPGLGASP